MNIGKKLIIFSSLGASVFAGAGVGIYYGISALLSPEKTHPSVLSPEISVKITENTLVKKGYHGYAKLLVTGQNGADLQTVKFDTGNPKIKFDDMKVSKTTLVATIKIEREVIADGIVTIKCDECPIINLRIPISNDLYSADDGTD
jgi:hypothetical protein